MGHTMTGRAVPSLGPWPLVFVDVFHTVCAARRRVPSLTTGLLLMLVGTGVAARRCADDGAILLAGRVMVNPALVLA